MENKMNKLSYDELITLHTLLKQGIDLSDYTLEDIEKEIIKRKT